MVKINMKGFPGVELKRGGLTIQRGGHLNKQYPLTTMLIREAGNGQEIEPAAYVLIRSSEVDWLNQVVTGKSYYEAPINKGFLEEIRAAAARDIQPSIPIPTRLDPMEEIVARAIPKPPTTQIYCVSQVSRIRMPEWPEDAREGRPEIMRDVSVVLSGHRALWIHTKDLEWLVRSLWIHQQLKGVADVGSDDACAEGHKSMEPDLTPEKCPRPQEAP